MAENHRWNPWLTLRERHWLTLEWAELEHGRGRLVDDGRRRVVQLDHRLSRRDRSAVLAHELVHDERDLLYDEHTPPGLVEKEEHAVRRITAERLVPLDALARYIARQDGGGVTVAMVAEEFDVSAEVAELALRCLLMSRRRSDGHG